MALTKNKNNFWSWGKSIIWFCAILVAIVGLVCLLSLETSTSARIITAGELDPIFSPTLAIKGIVNTVVTQPDDKVIIGGQFFLVNGIKRLSIARLNADGTLDSSFDPGIITGSSIKTIVLQTDGKILVLGLFNSLTSNTLVRLNSDGSVDNGFNVSAQVINQTSNLPVPFSIQPDGKIIVVGENSIIRRLNSDGSIDQTFNTNVSGYIRCIAIQPNGQILIGGDFGLVNGISRKGIARLNNDGSLDTVINPNLTRAIGSPRVHSIVVQPGGLIVAGGDFIYMVSGIFRGGVFRLNPDGTFDNAFNTVIGQGSVANTVALQNNGQVLVAGNFLNLSDQSLRRFVVRFNASGSFDPNFNSGTGNFPSGTVNTLTLQSNGNIFAGGNFSFYNDVYRTSIARLDLNGGVDLSFGTTLGNLGNVSASAIQPDGKIIIGGQFTNVNGVNRVSIARLNTDGTTDSLFTPVGFPYRFENPINTIKIQADGKIIVGGPFSYIRSGLSITCVARLNSDGTNDASFNLSPGCNDKVNAIAIQPDGKILIGGRTSNFNGTARANFNRLNTDGSFDNTFTTTVNFSVNTMELQSDGKLIIGGDFSTVNGVSRSGIARINSDGTLDAAFNPTNVQIGVRNIVIQPDGKILVDGKIRLNTDGSNDISYNYGGTSNTIMKFGLQTDGKIVIYSTASISGGGTNVVSRLNSNGSLDTSFIIGMTQPGSRDETTLDARPTSSVLIQPDGKILIGGVYPSYNNTFRTSFARILNNSSSAASRTLFDFDGDGRSDISVYRPSNGVWYLLNSQTGFTASQFGILTDRIVPADYDGDGRTDIAVYRDGIWYLLRSTLGFTAIQFGIAEDKPVPADFDGDGKAELVVYRPSNGTWYVFNLGTNQSTGFQFGISEDKPVVGDYDGDNRADYAVFRPSNGIWYYQQSTNGFSAIQFGLNTDRPVPADYDGDNRTDVAVYRPSNGTWYYQRSTAGFGAIQFGLDTDKPVPADYDGDGRADVAVFRPSNGIWYLQRSTTGFTGIQFGIAEDKPIPNAFVP